MQAWVDNSIWIGIVLSVLCWWFAKKVWYKNLLLAVRLTIAIIFSILVMGVLSTASSLLVHLFFMAEKVINLMTQTPKNGLWYFFETGIETAFFWLIALVLRLIYLTTYER